MFRSSTGACFSGRSEPLKRRERVGEFEISHEQQQRTMLNPRATPLQVPRGHARRITPPLRAAARGSQPTDPFVVLGVSSGTPKAQVRKRYLELIRQSHPDLTRSSDSTDQAALINASYEAILRAYAEGEVKERSQDDVEPDPFDRSQGEADQVFVNPFACPGVDPLEWRLLQEMVAARSSDANPDPEEVLRMSGVPTRSGVVNYLTPEQLAALIEEFEARRLASPLPKEHVKRRRHIRKDA